MLAAGSNPFQSGALTNDSAIPIMPSKPQTDSFRKGCYACVRRARSGQQFDSKSAPRRVYSHRAAGGERDHSDSRMFVVTRAGEIKGQGTGHRLRQQLKATSIVLAALRR